MLIFSVSLSFCSLFLQNMFSDLGEYRHGKTNISRLQENKPRDVITCICFQIFEGFYNTTKSFYPTFLVHWNCCIQLFLNIKLQTNSIYIYFFFLIWLRLQVCCESYNRRKGGCSGSKCWNPAPKCFQRHIPALWPKSAWGKSWIEKDAGGHITTKPNRGWP